MPLTQIYLQNISLRFVCSRQFSAKLYDPVVNIRFAALRKTTFPAFTTWKYIVINIGIGHNRGW